MADVRPRASRKRPAFEVVRISSWKKFEALVTSERFRSWGFRGQSNAEWPLESSLVRHLKFAGIHRDAWVRQEARAFRIFQRKAHLFLQHVPPEGDSFQWLSIMQHHGAPTRLLDVTWSPYVALYFALERGAKTASVWAINAAFLNGPGPRRVAGRAFDPDKVGTWVAGSYERDFLESRRPFVVLGEPRIMNQRLIAQSGSFVIPGVLDRSIDQIIGLYETRETLLVRIDLETSAMRDETLRRLYDMNLTPATLFPDLNGLAQSMAYELEFHWAYDPKTMKTLPAFVRASGGRRRRARPGR